MTIRKTESQSMFSNRDELLTASDVARILNVSLAFAYQLMQRGEIPTVHLGRSRRVRPSDLEDFIDNHTYSEQYRNYLYHD